MSRDAAARGGERVAVRDAARAELSRLAALPVGHPHLARYASDAGRIEAALLAALERDEGVLVAEAAGRPVGVAWWDPRGTFGRSPYLRLLAVAPAATGRGVGAALMDEVEQRAAAIDVDLFLLVSADNDRARAFYERRGYAVQGRIERYVLADVDELLMRRRLRE